MRRPPLLRPLEPRDGSAFETAFALIGWSKPRALFDRYLAEQAVGLRWTCVAEVNDAPTGYLTVAWRSADPELAARAIPEIVDLNVLPQHRRKGLGSSLLDAAEAEVAEHGAWIGLRVGLHRGYGAAQRLYVRRGYVPDGQGALYDGLPVPEGGTTVLDDDAALRMVKHLAPGSATGYTRALRAAWGSRLLLVPAVALVVHDAQGRLLLVEDPSTGTWNLPLAAIDPGQDAWTCAARLFQAEVGTEPPALELAGAFGGREYRHTFANGDRVEYALFAFRARVDAPSSADTGRPGRSWVSRETAPEPRFPFPETVLWR